MNEPLDPRKDRTALRLKLLRNGFAPLALKNKQCFLHGWPTLEVTEELISSKEWARSGNAQDTGIRCGDVVAIDLDIDDGELFNSLADELVASQIVAPSDFVRIGRPPREMWIYRTKAPIGKRTTGGFGNALIEKAAVEVLGKGSYFGAFGWHTDDVHLYTWPFESPLEHPFKDLPEITPAQIERLIEHACDFFVRKGLARLDAGGFTDNGYKRVYDLTPDMVFPVKDMGDMTIAQLQAFLLENQTTMLRCTVEALRPSTGGSLAGMISLVQGAVCISDHGTYQAHYPVELNPSDKMARLGAKLAAKLPPPPEPEELTDLSMDPREPFDNNLDLALVRYAYVMADDMVIDTYANTAPVKVAHFRNMMMPFFKVEEGQRGAKHVVRLADSWLQDADRRNVMRAEMRPDKPYPFYETHEEGLPSVNTYRPYQVPAGGDSGVGFDFLRHLLPDAAEREYFTQWLAYKLLNPGVRGPAIVMVASNTYGTGRGSLVALIRDMFGDRYVRDVTFKDLAGQTYQSQYNDWLTDSLIVAVSEAQDLAANDPEWKTRQSAYEHLKTIVDPGSTNIQVNRKGLSNYQGRTFSSMLVMTNHADALVLPENDRRFAILENGGTKPPEYWTDFHAWRSDIRNVGAFVEALKQTDLAGYNPYAAPPMTRAKAEMVDAGTSDLDRAFAAVLADLPGKLVVSEQIMLRIEDYLAAHASNVPPEWRRIAQRMYEKLTRKPFNAPAERVFIDGKQYRPRQTGPLEADVLRSVETMLEEIHKNGPTVRQISGGKVVSMQGRKAL